MKINNIFLKDWHWIRSIIDDQETYKKKSENDVKMGRVYLEHFGGSKLFLCAQCDTFLTNRAELISTRFTGATGRAFLFNKVVNLNYR